MSDQFIGEIRLFSGNYAPVGWAFCNGQSLQISQNEVLFSVIGTIYGGDGRTTFNLPDLRGRAGMHFGKSPTSGTTYKLGQFGGAEDVTLVTANLPAHTHTVMCMPVTGTLTVPNNNYWAISPVKQYSDGAAGDTMATTALTSAGGNLPHDNMMPYLTLSYIIALQGIFPAPQ